MMKSRRTRKAGHATCMGENRNIYRVSVGKPDGEEVIWKAQAQMGEHYGT
jgi:hypothetical protein